MKDLKYLRYRRNQIRRALNDEKIDSIVTKIYEDGYLFALKGED